MMMGEVPLSLHVKAELKEELEKEAHFSSQSASEIAEEAIGSYLDHRARLRKALDAAAAEADKGVFISSEAMLPWVKDLFDGKKTPPPKPDIFLPPRKR
jgi:predicted transcriptional regulator